jgi:drug/metabolite transporter (DMT)-like permease
VGCWTLGTSIANKLDMPHGGMGFAAEMLTAGVVALLVSAALGEHWALPHATKVWGAWAYLVVFGSLIAFSAYRYVVDRVSPTLAATYAYANPPVALFVGWWLGAEHFSANTFIGLPIVLIAVALHAWAWKLSTTAVRTQTPLQPATRTE